MKALKGLLIYVGIVLGLIFALGFFVFAIMYFVPSFRIMNIGVIHTNRHREYQEIVLSEYGDFNKIEISIGNKKIDANIIPMSKDAKEEEKGKIHCSLALNVFGLSFDITEYKIIKDVKVENSVMKVYLNVTEPNGWIAVNDSVLNVTVPTEYTYDIITNSETANISIGSDKEVLDVKNLSITSTTGGFTTYNLGVVEKIDEKTSIRTLSLDSLNVTTKSGKIDFTSIDVLNVNTKAMLYADDGDFKFNKLSSSLEIKGNGIRLVANEINCGDKGFNFIANNGYFSIKKLNSLLPSTEILIITENADINIDEINGKTGIVTTYGSVKVHTLSDTSYIESEHGDVRINQCLEDVSILTHFGNIIVESYFKNGTFESVKGNIKVNSTSDYIKGVTTNIKNRDGEIEVVNKENKLLVNTTGKSKVKVSFQHIKGNLNPNDSYRHTINIDKQGKCTVYMPTVYDVAYTFIAKGDITGSIRGLNGAGGIDRVQSSDEPQFYPDSTHAEDSKTTVQFLFSGTIHFEGYSS